MSKVTVPTQIQFILNQKRGWMIKQDIVDLLMRAYKAKKKKVTSDYITRALRDMAESSKIARREDKKGFVYYAPINTEEPPKYKVIYQPTVIDGKTVAVPKRIKI